MADKFRTMIFATQDAFGRCAMITIQSFVQLAQADAAPSATLSSTRIHPFIASVSCDRLLKRASACAVPV
jgi:hypothetical protein